MPIERRWIERTAPRSGWNRLWLGLLGIWSVVMAWDVWRVIDLAERLGRRASNIGHLAIHAAAGNKLTEVVAVWLAGAVVL
jgi:hypothetical protein